MANLDQIDRHLLAELQAEGRVTNVELAGRVGLTAGASTPEVLVTQVRDRLAALGSTSVRQLAGPRETVRFRLPAAITLGTQADARVPLPA